MRYLLTLFGLWLFSQASAQLTELPVTLSMPFDEDTIEETEPVFIWQSNLAALQTDPRLSQRLTVEKLLANQTPLEGLGLNSPVFLRDNLTSSTLSYSSTDHELEDNIWYAWQVSYLMNNMVIGQSEAWKFIRVKPQILPQTYIPLRRHSDLSFYTLNMPTLYFTTDEKGVFSMKAMIRSAKGEEFPLEVVETINGEPIQPDEETGMKRFFKADFESLELKNGTYTFYWYMNSNRVNVTHLKLSK